MRKALFSFLTVTYVFLMLSASFGSLCFENSKKSVQINWSDCEDMPGETEESTVEDNREYDENIKIDFAFGGRTIFPTSCKKIPVYLHLNGFHFPEIDSPPPQA